MPDPTLCSCGHPAHEGRCRARRVFAGLDEDETGMCSCPGPSESPRKQILRDLARSEAAAGLYDRIPANYVEAASESAERPDGREPYVIAFMRKAVENSKQNQRIDFSFYGEDVMQALYEFDLRKPDERLPDAARQGQNDQ